MATREENLKKINEGLELMSDEELEKVAGGTVGELADLAGAMADFPVIKQIGVGVAHTPGANYALAAAVADILKNQMGISADISLGFAGTGLNSDPNTYTEISTGKRLSHSEVLDRISKMDKHW